MNTNDKQNAEKKENQRVLLQWLSGIETFDGQGVKLTRIIGTPALNMLDPFLLLDYFNSDVAQDYIGGFPEHPHRGFETVTYLKNGRMRHKDNAGNEGIVEAGGVQWMTAGSGILHTETPEQQAGLLNGFQLWVNLPAVAKMREPAYQEYPPESIPVERRINNINIRVIAGQTDLGTVGPVINHYTFPTFMDITLPANTDFQQTLPTDHAAFIYVIDGNLHILAREGMDKETHVKCLSSTMLGVLSQGEQVSVSSGEDGACFLLIAGQPLNEPVARGGPFVMNTKAEVLQAFADFSRGSAEFFAKEDDDS